jgi:hypothetical protein
MPSRSKNLLDLENLILQTVDICATGTIRTVALRRAIFKQKKGLATIISLSLKYCSMGSSQPTSRDLSHWKESIQ